MKQHFLLNAISALALLACTGCGQDIFATHNTPQDLQQIQQGAASSKTQSTAKRTPQETIAGAPGGGQFSYTADGQDCSSRAQSRMSMFDRPDTYPISDQERKDAYQSLYSSCMREHDWQVAGPARAPVNTNYASLANLAPAAGGPSSNTVKAGNTMVSTSSVAGATVVVIGGGNNKDFASQLSSLSPSSGGSAPNATVVMVQSPQASAVPVPTYIPYASSSQPLPVAVPIPPKAYAPATPAPAPQPQAAYRPATRQEPSSALPPGESYSAQPSLAGAEGAASGAEQQSANRQLENVLEQ